MAESPILPPPLKITFFSACWIQVSIARTVVGERMVGHAASSKRRASVSSCFAETRPRRRAVSMACLMS